MLRLLILRAPKNSTFIQFQFVVAFLALLSFSKSSHTFVCGDIFIPPLLSLEAGGVALCAMPPKIQAKA